ncbi:hypothetical protein EYF80_022578 [Liparis tanakae]|uniref:Uncharacterized protein n=1 Tax=Liparis tanakae TaxID=230148 RepID=A0A4Z2HNN2_9TELE|nr:hypothetical protein EYF80_022578 [Liparis tanakae]
MDAEKTQNAANAMHSSHEQQQEKEILKHGFLSRPPGVVKLLTELLLAVKREDGNSQNNAWQPWRLASIMTPALRRETLFRNACPRVHVSTCPRVHESTPPDADPPHPDYNTIVW